jgi:hypothetical protein
MIEAKTDKPIAVKKQKDCNFVTLHDTSIFSDLRLPSGATHYVMWYKKSNPVQWGLTIKKFDDKEEFTSQYIWKLTWVYNEGENILVPTKASSEFTDLIKSDLTLRLNDIKSKYLNKKK